jgi:prepilin-type N-terminal cleavage/methylation domain-containing protein
MDCKGFTLIEALLAVAILGIALVGILPSFVTLLDANTLSEERSDAVAAAQLVMEDLRQTDPLSMPTSGSSAMTLVTVGGREYETVVSYCVDATYCRHVTVDVSFGGRTVYSVESVYTRLQ